MACGLTHTGFWLSYSKSPTSTTNKLERSCRFRCPSPYITTHPCPMLAVVLYFLVVLPGLWWFYAFPASHELRTTSRDLGILHHNATFTINTTLLGRHENDLPFPYGPRWDDFPDQNILDRAKMGLVRSYVSHSCRHRSGMCKNRPSTIDISTKQTSRRSIICWVAMLGDMGSGPREMADTVHTFSVVYGGGPSIGLTIDVCGISPNLKGFTNSARPDGRGAAMVLCPRTFDWYNPPLNWYSCDADFKQPTINENALVVGSIIVHELTHWFLVVIPTCKRGHRRLWVCWSSVLVPARGAKRRIWSVQFAAT